MSPVITCFGLLFGLQPAPDNSTSSEQASPDAVAEESPTPPGEASQERQAAQEAFARGDFDAAVAHFEKARALSPSSADLFNIGRVHEEAGHIDEAVDYYERFAKQPGLTLDERAFVAERLEVLRKLQTPEPEPEPEPPPPRVEAPPTSDPLDDRGRREPRPLLATGATLTGIGVVGGVVMGTVFGLRARGANDTVADINAGTNADRLTLTEVEDVHTRGQNAQTQQYVGIAVGGAVAVTGVILMAVDARRHAKARNNRSTAGVPVYFRF